MKLPRFFRKPTEKLTTAMAQAAQRLRHIEVAPTAKRIMPRGLARQWADLYRIIGDGEQFRIMASHLQLIVINESEGQDWNFVLDSAMADDRLSDADKDILVEMVLDMQQRSLTDDSGSPEEAEAAFKEMLMWE
jgi:hypothetical protein